MVCETCGAKDAIESDGIMLRCAECGATPQDEPDHARQVDFAVDRLFNIIARTRFRAPGTSADPYADALILWVSVVSEVREALAPLEHPKSALGEVEYLYRETIESWLRGEGTHHEYAEDEVTAQMMSDEDLLHKLRAAVDPPAVLVF